VVVAMGTITTDPDVPDGEKSLPVPLQAVALLLFQVRVVDRGYHIEAGDAERRTVGDAWLGCAAPVSACATAIAGGVVACQAAGIACSGGGVACVEVGISAAFDGMLELGAELTPCPEAISGKISKPSLILASTVFRDIRLYLC
jgi:hypothetical protein